MNCNRETSVLNTNDDPICDTRMAFLYVDFVVTSYFARLDFGRICEFLLGFSFSRRSSVTSSCQGQDSK